MRLLICLLLLVVAGLTSPAVRAQQDPAFVFGDMLPDAPELAPRGQYSVGVRTVALTNPNQLDVLHAKDGQTPRYNRPVTVEVWYPARMPAGKAGAHYV